ncbi:MAG TPA: ABC transporter ATP-binding protein [Baekduia sp.]|uniref:ABC transporter ATP-binding protein n=1 Tax=Baekduia sp. TaxID=2600305 RepID=UPI002D77EB1F|nr:ABC transporter ATP-binding protein [Baekduia sp.]HET6505396.1 ABC transporter ATP-binding protein [Baekduia sp.]
MTGAALALRGLHVEVPDGERTRVLLDGVDLALAPGELVVVTGASGSGKSTLLTYAGLLRRPARGEVLVAGAPTAGLSERARTAARREHVALVYQSANLLPSLTAREQLELVAHVRGEHGAAARRRADELLARAHVAHRADALPARLSGGERQRVGVARALMARPTVLLADEPTAALDPDLSAEIARLLASAARDDGVATLVVSHDDAPLAHADRHLRLTQGALVAG